MKFVRQVRLHNTDVFRLRIWHKDEFIAGWYVEFKVGNRQWNGYPGPRARRRQALEQFRKREMVGPPPSSLLAPKTQVYSGRRYQCCGAPVENWHATSCPTKGDIYDPALFD